MVLLCTYIANIEGEAGTNEHTGERTLGTFFLSGFDEIHWEILVLNCSLTKSC